jgi:hypothetical protein
MKSRTRLPKETWQALKSDYMVGSDLRALARRCGIPEDSVVSRAHREGWSEERLAALELLKPQRDQERTELDHGQLTELYHQNAAGLCQRLSAHICALPEGAAFDELGKVNLADLKKPSLPTTGPSN